MAGQHELEAAILEARRFLHRAEYAQSQILPHGQRANQEPHDHISWAAVKQSAKDLARALTDLRRPT